MVNALGESARRSGVRVCTMARRGMPEVRFDSDVYLWGRHESVLATLWRTIASQLASLGGGVVLFASPPTAKTIGSYHATVAPSLVGPVSA